MNSIMGNDSDEDLEAPQVPGSLDGLVLPDPDGSALSDNLRPDYHMDNPWPYVNDYFEFQYSQNHGKQFLFKCLKCLPVCRYYKAQKRSLYGLRSHIARKHKDVS